MEKSTPKGPQIDPRSAVLAQKVDLGTAFGLKKSTLDVPGLAPERLGADLGSNVGSKRAKLRFWIDFGMNFV